MIEPNIIKFGGRADKAGVLADKFDIDTFWLHNIPRIFFSKHFLNQSWNSINPTMECAEYKQTIRIHSLAYLTKEAGSTSVGSFLTFLLFESLEEK